MTSSLHDLWFGFGIAFEPHNLMWCLVGVVIGNVVGVLPGMGVMATLSILLPLTFAMKPVAAVLLLPASITARNTAGRSARSCSICPAIRRTPSPASTAFPLTHAGQGRNGAVHHDARLVRRRLVRHHRDDLVSRRCWCSVAMKFGPAEISALMLLGLLAGATLTRGSPLKGIAMTLLGLLLAMVGQDMQTGMPRFTFGIKELYDGVEIVALALGLFGIAEFMNSVNRIKVSNTHYANVGFRDMRPSRRGSPQIARFRRCCAAR